VCGCAPDPPPQRRRRGRRLREPSWWRNRGATGRGIRAVSTSRPDAASRAPRSTS
jgi:hypothetical protein